jgi:hypothetical protein
VGLSFFDWVHIRCWGNGFYWFRFYSGLLGKTERRPAPSNQALLPLSLDLMSGERQKRTQIPCRNRLASSYRGMRTIKETGRLAFALASSGIRFRCRPENWRRIAVAEPVLHQMNLSQGHLFHCDPTVVFGSGGYFTKSECLFQGFLMSSERIHHVYYFHLAGSA